MKDHNERRAQRGASILAAVACVMLTASGAAAEEIIDDESSFLDDDADVYGYYDAGFDDVNENDDWFYDYFGLEDDAADDFLNASYSDNFASGLDDDLGTDTLAPEDDDATDLGGDDAGDEGVWDW